MTYSNIPITFQVCLVRKAHQLAKEFSKKQKDSSKAQQVYHNTLAVWAVAYYMKCMEIETDWEGSDSWDALMQSFLNVADLVLPGIGKLECRPFMQEEQNIYIPLDVSQDRLAYVAVQLDNFLETARTATILGFVKTAPIEELPINKLQSLEKLLQLIEQSKLLNLTNTSVQLSKWLEPEDNVQNKWLPLAAVFKGSAREDLASSIRNSESLTRNISNNSLATASRGKIINLGIKVQEHQVALVITIAPGENENIDIMAQVYAIKSLNLPKQLKLDIIDETEQSFLQAESREKDQFIQLIFFGKVGEKFSIKLALGNDSITEFFVI